MSGPGSRKSSLRTIDVARRSGYSVQQIRDLEQDGVLPPADRTPAGYRTYTDVHVRAALAYRALAAGVGPVEARTILRSAHRGPAAELLALLDAAHARLDAERRALALAQQAVASIAEEQIDDPRSTDAMTVTELAGALGVRPSTLRHWDAEGLLLPGRTAAGNARSYSPRDVRDARIVHELRRAGYRIEPLKELMPQFREARRWEEVRTTLAAREAALTARSRALLHGAAPLSALLSATDPPS